MKASRPLLWLSLMVVAVAGSALHLRNIPHGPHAHLRLVANPPSLPGVCHADVDVDLGGDGHFAASSYFGSLDMSQTGVLGDTAAISQAVSKAIQAGVQDPPQKHDMGWDLVYQFVDAQDRVLTSVDWSDLSKPDSQPMKAAVTGILGALPEPVRRGISETMIKSLVPEQRPYRDLCAMLGVREEFKLGAGRADSTPDPVVPGELGLHVLPCPGLSVLVSGWTWSSDKRYWTLEMKLENHGNPVTLVWRKVALVVTTVGTIVMPDSYELEPVSDSGGTRSFPSSWVLIPAEWAPKHSGASCTVGPGTFFLYLHWTCRPTDHAAALLWNGVKLKIPD